MHENRILNVLRRVFYAAAGMRLYTQAQDQAQPAGNIAVGASALTEAGRGDSAKNLLATIQLPLVGGAQKIHVYHGETSPVGGYPNAPIGSIFIQESQTSGVLTACAMYQKTGATEWSEIGAGGTITDPGDAGAIPVTKSGVVAIVTGGGETRTLAIPTFLGQRITLCLDTDGGDAVVTVASAVNQTGNNTLTFSDAGEEISLHAISVGGTLAWRVSSNDGVVLSTV